MNNEQPVSVKNTRVKPCKRLPVDATREEIAQAHKIELGARAIIRQHNSERHRNTDHIFANLSKNHPNYGETPAEHDRRKNSS